jgi:hypothetical protein
VLVGSAADFTQKVSQVGLLGESGKLRSVIQPDIEKALDAIGF